MATLAGQFAGSSRPAGDKWWWRTAYVEAVDADAHTLEVTIDGALDTTVVPHVDGDYKRGDRVALVRNPDRSLIALGTIAAEREAAAESPAGVGGAPTGLALERSGSRVDATWNVLGGATQYRYRTTLDGGTTWTPAEVAATESATLGVGQGKTLGVQVAGYVASAWTAWSATVSVTYPVPAPTYETVEATIVPSDSGTYRVSSSQWDDWNVGRFGGPRDVYQGNAYGSGDLVGWVGYGDRIADLNAAEIISITLKVKRQGWIGFGNASITVQGSTAGTQPGGNPSSTGTGSTATTPSVAVEKWAQVALAASVCEALRTGAVKGFVAAGGADGGWYGLYGSFALTIKYRKAA